MLQLDDVLVIVLSILLIVILMKSLTMCEGLVSRPDAHQRDAMANEILSNSRLFTVRGGTLEKAQSAMGWMDAVTYEDARLLAREGRLTSDNVRKILS